MERKVALVTGAGQGIGAGIALALAKDGFDVAINDISFNIEKAEEVAKQCKELGVNAVAVSADVSKYEECEKMVNEVVLALGGIDVLVNNAGITRDGLLMRMTEQQFDSVIDVNLKSAFNMCRLVSPILFKKKGGRIINISSVSGVYGNAGQVNYSASKAGLIGITKSLSKELGGRSITVNAIAPGFIDTEMTRALSDDVRTKAAEKISLKRFGSIDDIANAVCFLAGEKGGYITGQVLVIDGGLAL